MEDTTLPLLPQLFVEMWKTSARVVAWDTVAAANSTAVGYGVTTTEVYHALLDTGVNELVYAVARDTADHDALRRCAAWPEPFVRELVARNPQVHPRVLDELSYDPHPLVRWQVAQRVDTAPATLERLAAIDDYPGQAARRTLRLLALPGS